MSKSDFFSFITSLRPIELKAIGELSQVMHLEEGVTVYSSGDLSDALYIINRGVVELIHEDQRRLQRTAVSYLGRGDIFGETEVLSEEVRKNAIRTCEPVSLQCFKKKDFPELIRRVPNFFFYLSQQLASQLNKATDLANVQSHCVELGGNLENFDMVTVYQTILSSAQSGELVITNEVGERNAVFTFESGVPRHAQFYHLVGEEAFWQLFLHEKLSGTFSFSSERTEASVRAANGPCIRRHSTDLLLSALQSRDEFRSLMDSIPDPTMFLHRIKLNLEWSDEPGLEELRGPAEEIWQLCYSSMPRVGEVFERMAFCELKFYKAVLQLLRTGHFALVLSDQPEETGSGGAAQKSTLSVAMSTNTIPFAPNGLRSSPAVVRA